MQSRIVPSEEGVYIYYLSKDRYAFMDFTFTGEITYCLSNRETNYLFAKEITAIELPKAMVEINEFMNAK